MTFIEDYQNLLIRQYFDKPNALAEITLYAEQGKKVKDFHDEVRRAFDVDIAFGKQLDIIGKIVGRNRLLPQAVPKIRFGFDDNPDARGFGDRFEEDIFAAPFADRFTPDRTNLELSDPEYRIFLKLKIAKNTSDSVVAGETSIQRALDVAFDGRARLVDKQNMKFDLYVSKSVKFSLVQAALNIDILPSPAGVQYDGILEEIPGDIFGFQSNPNALGFGNRFDDTVEGGKFVERLSI